MTVTLHPDECAVLLSVARLGRNVTRQRLSIDAGIEERFVQGVVTGLCAKGLLAVDLNRFGQAVDYRIVKWPRGLRRPDGRTVVRKRRCLGAGCGRRFKSSGAGHRICDTCKDSALFAGAVA